MAPSHGPGLLLPGLPLPIGVHRRVGDGGPVVAYTSLWDALSDGNRTSSITITTTASVNGSISNLINGTLATDLWWGSGQASREIKLDFGSGNAVVIDGFGWHQDTAAGQGDWALRGSNDDSSYTNLDTKQGASSFTLVSSVGPSNYQTFSNVTAYRYYKLVQVSGATSQLPWLYELTLRITSSPLTPRDALEKGDRTSLITATTTATTNGGTTVDNLIDGDYRGVTNDYLWFVNGQSTREIKFDLGVAKKITDFAWVQSGAASHGTWIMEGSNDDSSYTQLGSSFTLGAAAIDKHNLSNSTAYRYYKLRQTSGTTSDGPAIYEIEFKIAP